MAVDVSLTGITKTVSFGPSVGSVSLNNGSLHFGLDASLQNLTSSGLKSTQQPRNNLTLAQLKAGGDNGLVNFIKQLPVKLGGSFSASLPLNIQISQVSSF